MKIKEGFWGLKDGWKDRGEVGHTYGGVDGVYNIIVCSFDKTTARIAIKKNTTILYCPKCLTILKEQ